MGARKPDNIARFTIGDESYEIDPEKLTLAETADVEEHFDADFEDLRSMQGLLAMVYIAMRRKNPSTTWAEVGALEITAVQDTKPKRPTRAAPEAAGTQAS